mmetsp:Transcript_28005/g.73922  ORF Transcript_28005/g.73922 Transcript_28005/m.73922 type:complete len:114 (+) Transcript_28005:1635-1976(+)
MGDCTCGCERTCADGHASGDVLHFRSDTWVRCDTWHAQAAEFCVLTALEQDASFQFFDLSVVLAHFSLRATCRLSLCFGQPPNGVDDSSRQNSFLNGSKDLESVTRVCTDDDV